MSYIIHQNPLNQGSLSGRYSLKDLSNSGKFTGYINSLPIRRNVECLVDTEGHSVVTVSNGSLLTIPNGVTETASTERECEYIRLTRDISISVKQNSHTDVDNYKRYIYVLYDTVNDELIAARGNAAYEDPQPFINRVRVNELNKITMRLADYKVFVNGNKCSLPIGYFDGEMNWHTFDAMGFVDTMFWVEESVEGLFPEGRDTTSNYKCGTVDINWLTFTKFTSADAKAIPSSLKSGVLMLRKSGKVLATTYYGIKDTYKEIENAQQNGYYFAFETNKVYQKVDSAIEEVPYVKLCEFTASEGKITSISNYNLYRPQSVAPLESRVSDIETDVADLQEVVGDSDLRKFLDKEAGGLITGKTEYTMHRTSATELVNREFVMETVNKYAKLDGASFTGVVTGVVPPANNNGAFATVGWVNARVPELAIARNAEFSGVISGTFNDTKINVSNMTQQNFIELFNQMTPNFAGNSLSLQTRTYYRITVPGWIQWVCNENDAAVDLKIGENISSMYTVSRVRAAAGDDACGTAALIPVAIGQFIYSGLGNFAPVFRFFPIRKYTNSITISPAETDPTSGKEYYEIM